MRILFIVYDNAHHINHFPIGIAQLTGVLEKYGGGGYEIDLYLQDIHHYPEIHLAEYLKRQNYDFIGLSFIGGYWQYRKALAISKVVNETPRRPFYCIGGHGPSPEPEYFLNITHADAVCIGEGEETILELLYAVEHKVSLKTVRGIAWKDGDTIIVNERRPLIQDIDSIPLPAYHRFPMEIYRLSRMPHCSPTDFICQMLSGRGCTFRCNFCYRMDKGFRPRSNEAIIEEICLLKMNYGITYIAFFDELLMSGVARTTSLCEDFLKYGINIKWDCNGRLNYAEPELLRLMRRAGCVFINYGIEAFDDDVLKNMGKALTKNMIERGIQATLEAGISPGLNIIWGNIGDNRQTLQAGVDFLLKYDDGAQVRTIRPVTPYPGCDLYYEAIKRGLLKDCADFYENKHTNSDLLTINFTELSDNAYYEALLEANRVLLNNYHKRNRIRLNNQLYNLYRDKNTNFRGFR
jgi:radical SAM superfamily enzyme YgiQ (UPF0313 family)